MSASKIEWTDATWNPTRGCSRVSPGCDHCYAIGQAHRFSGPGGPYKGVTRMTPRGPDWSGVVRLVPEMLNQPLRWRKPRRIFVDSMSDLFHESLDFHDISAVFGVMAHAKQHTFQILTKRAARMRAFLRWMVQLQGPPIENHEGKPAFLGCDPVMGADLAAERRGVRLPAWQPGESPTWPLPNVWLGVSAEDQRHLTKRAGELLATPAAVRFLSCEPLLGPLDLSGLLGCFHAGMDWRDHETDHSRCAPTLDLVIVGGESGPGARPCDVEWIRSIRDQCREAGAAVFVKQLGARPFERRYPPTPYEFPEVRDRKGGDPAEWPVDLRVREFPEKGARPTL